MQERKSGPGVANRWSVHALGSGQWAVSGGWWAVGGDPFFLQVQRNSREQFVNLKIKFRLR